MLIYGIKSNQIKMGTYFVQITVSQCIIAYYHALSCIQTLSDKVLVAWYNCMSYMFLHYTTYTCSCLPSNYFNIYVISHCGSLMSLRMVMC